jgi:hypothetical protein
MANTFDISKIYGKTLGKQYSDAVEEKEYSSSGTALWKKTKLGTLEYLPVTLGELEIPNALITITGKKNIVETPMVGRKGTIKELINIEDYDIKITGLWINDESNDYPEEEVAAFMKLWKKNESVKIVNALTDIIFTSDDSDFSDMVVTKGFSMPDMKGIQHAQVIQIDCVSDQYFELEIE